MKLGQQDRSWVETGPSSETQDRTGSKPTQKWIWMSTSTSPTACEQGISLQRYLLRPTAARTNARPGVRHLRPPPPASATAAGSPPSRPGAWRRGPARTIEAPEQEASEAPHRRYECMLPPHTLTISVHTKTYTICSLTERACRQTFAATHILAYPHTCACACMQTLLSATKQGFHSLHKKSRTRDGERGGPSACAATLARVPLALRSDELTDAARLSPTWKLMLTR